MKRIYVATNARGFLLNLFNDNYDNIKFYYKSNKVYETNSKRKLFLSKLIKSKIADYLGIIQRIRVNDTSFDNVFSYNRFIESKTEYIIYLENPLALVHYSTGRNKTLLSRLKLKRYLCDPNLKSIICLSKACYETVNCFYSIPSRIKIEQIYPFVKPNQLTSSESIRFKSQQKDITCLYISSNFNLKGGAEILTAFNKLKDKNVNNIKLKIITQVDLVDNSIKNRISENENISLFDFKFNKDELNQLYNDSCIYLNPTRQDSFSLVVLEAMKSGNAILATDLYAIPEMVEDGYNGYLTKPMYRFFGYDNMPNNDVWNNREGTIYSNYVDENIVDFLIEKINQLNSNRVLMERMMLNSFKKSNSGEFNDKYIKDKWSKMLLELQ